MTFQDLRQVERKCRASHHHIAAGIVGLLLSLAWLVLKVLLVVGIVYWLISVFSPDTARKMRESLRGERL